ncbi:hypothetical protein FRC06_000452 [Ceratobasidium sp. 370]|nr:hypothetical protein FRC06_000452 [Ceratobasidium sp. 370]
MAKRKVVGGYVAYSDDEDEDPEPAPAAKKPYQPSILAAPVFKPPTSSRTQPSVSRVQAFARSQPAVLGTAHTPVQKAATPSGARAVLPTPRETPVRTSYLAPSSELDVDERRSSTPIAQNRSRGKERAMIVEAGTSTQRSQPPARLAYERQINELDGAVAEGAVTIAEQGREIDHLRGQVRELTERLNELTKSFGEFCQAQATRWTQAEIIAHATAPAVPAAPAAPAVPVGPPNAGTPEAVMVPVDFNPRVDTSSYVPVSEAGVLASIVAAFHHRPAADKPKICEFTSLQRLVRVSFYESLDNVSQAGDIKPPFFDADGVHELFPAHLANPTTNFVNAYPDWDSDLGTQVAFLQRVLHRIRTAAPKNASDYSVVARTILEELLIEMIIDGPWNTCVTKWRKLSGDPEKIKAEYKRRRLYHRKAAKAGTRAEFRTEIPALADERYDSLFHSGMMSDEETDEEEEGGGEDNGEAEVEVEDQVKGEGESEGSLKGKGRRGRKKKYRPLGVAKQKPDAQKVFKVLRPDMRSSFANALYDAGSECIRQKRRALHGNSFQPLKRKTTVVVKTDEIPDVRRDGKIIKIPLFMFSSVWRRKHKTLIDRSAHLIDLDLKNPPDLDAFFHKYQRQENEEGEGPVPEPVPERPWPDVTDDQDDLGLDDGDEDARRLVDGGEVWVNDVEGNMGLGAGEDGEIGELGEEDERDANEELDPRTLNPGPANAPQVAAPTDPIAAQVPTAVIDPVLRGGETEASAPTTSRPRPKPKPRPPPVDNPPPAPTSSIHIWIPPLNNYIAPLPEPHPDHGAQRSPSPNLPPPAQATQAKPGPTYKPQMPHGGPPHPPPPLVSDPPPPVEPEQPPERMRRAAGATSAGPSAQQSGAGESTTVGGKKGKKGKGGEIVAPVAGDGAEGPAAPSVPAKRRRGRPPKDPKV